MPESHVSIIKVENQCNWLQALEGVLDSAHVSFLHSTEVAPVRAPSPAPMVATPTPRRATWC